MNRQRKVVYLISREGGIAFACTEGGAVTLELGGYYRCSREEYDRARKRLCMQYPEPLQTQLLEESNGP